MHKMTVSTVLCAFSFECALLTLVQAISDWAKSRTLQQQRQFLPVYDCREELLQVIRENQVVVVVGETGSGKTTQVMLLPLGSQSHKLRIYVMKKQSSICPLLRMTDGKQQCSDTSFQVVCM